MRSTTFALPLSLGVLSVGVAGYLSLPRGSWGFYFFAHLGALGVVALFGCAAGFLARRRRRAFWTAFGVASLVPIAAGAIAVLVFWVKRGHLYCGGAVTLPVALLILMVYVLAPSATSRSGGGTPVNANDARASENPGERIGSCAQEADTIGIGHAVTINCSRDTSTTSRS